MLEALYTQHGELRERIAGEDGELRRFVNVYLKGEDIRFLDGLATPVTTGTRSRSCRRWPAGSEPRRSARPSAPAAAAAQPPQARAEPARVGGEQVGPDELGDARVAAVCPTAHRDPSAAPSGP